MPEKYKKTEDRKLYQFFWCKKFSSFYLQSWANYQKNIKKWKIWETLMASIVLSQHLSFVLDVLSWKHEKCFFRAHFFLTLEAPTSQYGQTHSNNSSAVTDALSECVWPFREVGSWRDHVTVNAFVLIPKPRVKIVTTSQILWTISFFNGLVMIKKIHHSATPFLKYGDVR